MPPKRGRRVPIAPVAPENEGRDIPPPPIPMPVAPALVQNPIPPAPELMEDFGRDKNLKTLLKSLQPKAFTGEGVNVPNILEEWIIQMDDYFALAEYNSIARGIMGRAKLEGPAKMWWKLNCQSRNVTEGTQGWEELKFRLQERYFPLNFSTTKMNEFLSCTRRGKSIENYYEEFVKLSRYAPLMSEEQKLSRFILGLEGNLADEVDALRPISLADALIRAKAKLNSFFKGGSTLERKREAHSFPNQPYRVFKVPNVQKPIIQSQPAPQSIQVNALPITQSGRPIQCFRCQEWGHKRAECPNGQKFVFPNQPLPLQNKLAASTGQGRSFKSPGTRSGNQSQAKPPPTNPNPRIGLQKDPPRNTTVNFVFVKEEVEEQAQIYAALDPSGHNRQFSILEAQGGYEGRSPDETRADFRHEGTEVAPEDYSGSLSPVEGIPN